MVIGNKLRFAIEYNLVKYCYGELRLYVDNACITCFKLDNVVFPYKGNIQNIVDWFRENLEIIKTEEKFPFIVDGNTALELYENASSFDSEDDEKFDSWHDKRYDWQASHNWFRCRENGFLIDLFFRRVEDKIELSWDNTETYKDYGVRFSYPKGLKFIDIYLFEKIIKNFIENFEIENKKLKNVAIRDISN